ncbi:hypothetical protein HY212_07850 [Candidatus Pacearchaeota archaeon]|nr:hypothetical protein [Candidatus Pacearchaeota archaeon]
MGKNRDTESLVRLMVNTIVHEIVVKHTNKPESKHFLSSEIAEYRNQTEKMAEQHNWNDKDKEQIREKILKRIKEKLSSKYPDVSFSAKEAEKLVNEEIKDLL